MMKRLLIALLFAASLDAAAISFVQGASVLNSKTLAYSTNVTTGDLLAVFAGGGDGTCPTAISDTLGNTWNAPVCVLGGSGSALAYFGVVSNGTGADTITLTWTWTTGTYTGIVIGEYALPSTSALTVGTVIPQSGGGYMTVTQRGIVPSGTDYAILTGMVDAHSDHTWASGTGTVRQSLDMVACGCTMAIGDSGDLSGGLVPGTPYSATYGDGLFAGSGGLLYQNLLLVATSGGGGPTPHASASAQ